MKQILIIIVIAIFLSGIALVKANESENIYYVFNIKYENGNLEFIDKKIEFSHYLLENILYETLDNFTLVLVKEDNVLDL
jgi:cytochrome b561